MKKIFLVSILSTLSLYAGNIYATFDVEAQKSASVAFSTSGIVNNVHVTIGDVVRENQTLSTLKNRDIEALLDIQKTNLNHAKKDYDRQKKVKNIIDQEKFDNYAFKYESAKANVAYQQALLDKTILKAPFDGIITSKEIESGDVVSGQMIKTAFNIQSVSMRKLILKIDQKYHNKIKIGDIFKYKVDGNSSQYEGEIYKIYPTVDMTNRKMIAEVKAKDIPVGLFGDGYIVLK